MIDDDDDDDTQSHSHVFLLCKDDLFKKVRKAKAGDMQMLLSLE